MRKLIAVAVCLSVVALVFTFAQAQQRGAATGLQIQPVQIVPAVTAWEYTSFSFAPGQANQLNNLGNQGWELVDVTTLQMIGMEVSTFTAFFKRPKMQ